MGNFIQLHILTSYPPANLNRDDLGRPKTAIMGGVQRLRISSQSLKRAWRTSEVLEKALAEHIGVRTKEMGVQIYNELIKGEIKEKQAKEWSQAIAEQFGKLKKENKEKPQQELEIEQLAHFSPEESKAIKALTKSLIKNRQRPTDVELNILREKHKAADIALFGRMLADKPIYNMEAAAQVAHAITVHKVAVEDDYFTAVDDLNKGEEDMGAAHIGVAEFAAGLFYLYVCLDRNLLVENLTNDEVLAQKTIRALAEAAITIAPSGKQNSYASRAYASYVLAEKGDRQPRSLSVAFLAPVKGENMLDEAIKRMETTRENMDGVYFGWTEKKLGKKDKNGQDEIIKEAKSLPSRCINTMSGEGELQELLKFVEN